MNTLVDWLLYLLPSVIEVDIDNDDAAACSGRTGGKKRPRTNTRRRSFLQYLLQKVDGDGKGSLTGRIYYVYGEGQSDDDIAL